MKWVPRFLHTLLTTQLLNEVVLTSLLEFQFVWLFGNCCQPTAIVTDKLISEANPHSVAMIAGVYCSGWLKRGPVGMMGATMKDAFETGKSLVTDLSENRLPILAEHVGAEAIEPLLRDKGTDWHMYELSLSKPH